MTSKVVEAATSQAPLNTGSKLRGSYLSKEPALAFATMMICSCIMFSGRSALSERPETQAHNQLKGATPVVRSLFNAMALGSKFNGAGAMWPELALLGLSSGQALAATSVKMMQMTEPMRVSYESQIAASIWRGSRPNPQIIEDQRT